MVKLGQMFLMAELIADETATFGIRIGDDRFGDDISESCLV